eukprot:1323505-Amphidinium_carterae.1
MNASSESPVSSGWLVKHALPTYQWPTTPIGLWTLCPLVHSHVNTRNSPTMMPHLQTIGVGTPTLPHFDFCDFRTHSSEWYTKANKSN